MSYIPLEKLIDKADGSMYKLVTLASRRALELSEGAPRMVEMPKDTKVTTVALKEIAEGKLVFKKEEKEKENKTSAA